MIGLSKEQVVLLHEFLIKETGSMSGIRDEGLLESALNGNRARRRPVPSVSEISTLKAPFISVTDILKREATRKRNAARLGQRNGAKKPWKEWRNTGAPPSTANKQANAWIKSEGRKSDQVSNNNTSQNQ
jgi:hypothetical protein